MKFLHNGQRFNGTRITLMTRIAPIFVPYGNQE